MAQSVETVINLITGPLGSGKTTAILSLLGRREERWGVLVNEVGQVGIDQDILKASGVAVREVVGGCVCCANSVVFGVALSQLVAKERPKRVLVEPSGLGEGLRLKQKVRSLNLKLGAVIVMLPADSHDELWETSSLYRNQLAAADVFVINRRDATGDGGAKVIHFARNFFPPKHVTVADFAAFDLNFLDIEPMPPLSLPFTAHQNIVVNRQDLGNGVLRYTSTHENRILVGYLISDKWVFHESRVCNLREFQGDPHIDRAKAIFRCLNGHSRIVHFRGAATGGDLTVDPHTLATDDSRIQLIFLPQSDPDASAVTFICSRFQAHLLASGQTIGRRSLR